MRPFSSSFFAGKTALLLEPEIVDILAEGLFRWLQSLVLSDLPEGGVAFWLILLLFCGSGVWQAGGFFFTQAEFSLVGCSQAEMVLERGLHASSPLSSQHRSSDCACRPDRDEPSQQRP